MGRQRKKTRSRTKKSTKQVRWRDRVRENSVVKKFGPRSNVGDRMLPPASLTIGNILEVLNYPVGQEVPSISDVTYIPSRGFAHTDAKYIVQPTVKVVIKFNGEDSVDLDDLPINKCDKQWPDASHLMRGVTSQKISVDSQGSTLDDGEKVEVSSVSYLTIPNAAGSRRPSTADLVIEKLKVEKVDGGGLSIQGVSLASNCHVTLCVFGTFFLVAGLILSYISFSVNSPDTESEETDSKKRSSNSDSSSVSQMRKIGPSFISIGLLMLILGITFYTLAKKLTRDEKARRKALSERQLNQLENSFSHAHATTSPMHTAAPAAHEQYPILSVRRNSWWVDPPPVESSDGISPDARDFAVQCPSPHGDSQGVGSPPPISPVPSELRAEHGEPYVDIACFPNPPLSRRFSTDSSRLPTITNIHETQGPAQSNSQPSSASQGRSYPGPVLSDNPATSGSTVPYIQVTQAQPPPYAPTSVPKLPRLSRHCSTRIDSRPTTADSR